MGDETGIKYVHHAFTPWIGCEEASEGCKYCYARSMSGRFGWKEAWTGGTYRRMSNEYWRKPIRWNREAERAGERRRVLCGHLCDWCDPKGFPDERDRLWDIVRATPGLDWFLLTKRPEQMDLLLPSDWGDGWENVFLGVTIENHAVMVRRMESLAKTPAKHRWLSLEPWLEEIEILPWLSCPSGVDWVVAGGESGANARPFDLSWGRRIIQDCQANGVPVFFKQIGGNPYLDGVAQLRPHNRMGNDPAFWPDWLRVKEFPAQGGA